MDVSIITVTWNNAEQIARQLKSAQEGVATLKIEQHVIDNGSKDDTVDIVKKQFPEVNLISNKVGKGFGGANMQGVEASSNDVRYYLFLNPDMKVEKGSIDTFVAWMDKHPDVGIASPKLLDEHGKLNMDATPRRFPRVWEQVALILKVPHIFPSIMNKYMMTDIDADTEQDVDSVRGSFMLMRKEFVDKLGFAFDPRYFIWYEDVDICREANRLGYRVVHTPIISAVDYIGQSFKKRETLWKQKNFTKSMLQYFQKWEPWYKWMWIALFRPVGIALAWLNDKVHKK
ncbi:glycosyltransferase family 2 protein [Patescibacteria group bacterium]|nr:glycosyltransferase family 2 protein [Patescibacteria group bacterium]MBU1721730.1 glycosyltransferase family 2 protein [Patescibacteria group bacterium]MBU1901431.1 glycosyltransferase family 2 protein [Patescibacteria group bacterium]